MAYEIGDALLTLADVKELLGYYPRSAYAPGAELVNDHGGGLQVVGYPRSTWTFAALSIEDYEELLQTTLGFSLGQYSGECYICTRDEFDNWEDYYALLRLPNPATLERHGEHYLNLQLEFVLLEIPT